MCILLRSVFNEDIVSFVYHCNDRQLIIMTSLLLCDEWTGFVDEWVVNLWLQYIVGLA